MQERREFPRWRCLIPCTCSGENFQFEGQVVDLSYGGACVAQPTEIAQVGSKLTLVVGGSCVLKSKITYLNREKDNPKQNDYLGLEFLDPWPERVSKLKPLFTQHLNSR